MLKLGILTFHRGYNCGAFLQALYLSRVLSSLGVEVKIINYESRKSKKNEIKHLFRTKNPKYLFQNIIKFLKFHSARKQFVLTKFSTNLEDILREEQFDAVIFGSDEIWNYQNAVSGLDLNFFGSLSFDVPKIAYAVSFGDVRKEKPLNRDIKDRLLQFKNISVRDNNSKEILTNNNIGSVVVSDPTMILEKKINNHISRKNKFILVYATFLSSEIVKEIKKFARRKSLKILCICYHVPGLSCNLGIGPFDFEYLFENAEYILTNTLHGTLFSIRNKKKFCVVFNEYRRNKLENIIADYDIEYLTDENFSNLETMLEREINYELIFSRVAKNRDLSIRFLKDALADVAK